MEKIVTNYGTLRNLWCYHLRRHRHIKRQMPAFNIDRHFISIANLPRDDLSSERRFDLFLKETFQWPRAVNWVVPFARDQCPSWFGDLDFNYSVRNSLPQIFEQQIDDFFDLLKF